MDAVITIKIKEVDQWDQFENKGTPEIESEIKDYTEDQLGMLGYDDIQVKVDSEQPDYKALLKKYINWVALCEGTDFISFNSHAKTHFTEKELEQLKQF